jgi:hypothetical protein
VTSKAVGFPKSGLLGLVEAGGGDCWNSERLLVREEKEENDPKKQPESTMKWWSTYTFRLVLRLPSDQPNHPTHVVQQNEGFDRGQGQETEEENKKPDEKTPYPLVIVWYNRLRKKKIEGQRRDVHSTTTLS